ncbi:MAG TPA: hypothetical protein V6C76_13620 [Drouetiella sp.]
MSVRRNQVCNPRSGSDRGILALTLVALLFGLSATSARADEKGWVLSQKSTTLGDQYMYISPNGLKCVNPRIGVAMVTHAPDWNITMFNDKTRSYYQTTLDGYKAKLAQRGLTSDLASRQWTRATSGTIAGMKATQYVMRGGTIVRNSRNGAKTSSVSAADYWVSDDIQVPSRLGELLSSAYGLPMTQNVPLRLESTDAKGPHNMLETFSMQVANIPTGYFNCPAGYKAVTSEAEVMMNDEQKQMFEDMSKDMGGGLEAPRQAAPRAAAPQQAAPASGGNDPLSKLLDAYKKQSK